MSHEFVKLIPTDPTNIRESGGQMLIDFELFADAHIASNVVVKDGTVTKANIRTPQIDDEETAEAYYNEHGEAVRPFDPLQAIVTDIGVDADTYASTNVGTSLTPSVEFSEMDVEEAAAFLEELHAVYDHAEVLQEL